MTLWSEFKQFLLKQNALALAVGVIIGASIGKVVSAIADDVVNPIAGLLLPAGDWRNARIVLTRATDAAGKVTENAIAYGDLLGRVIDFFHHRSRRVPDREGVHPEGVEQDHDEELSGVRGVDSDRGETMPRLRAAPGGIDFPASNAVEGGGLDRHPSADLSAAVRRAASGFGI